MSDGIRVTIEGIPEFDAKISVIADKAKNMNGALMEGGKIIETACKEQCPVDTGLLRSSIQTAAVGENGVQVAPHTDYAAYVEFGTYKMSAQPYMRPGFESSRQAAIDHIRAKLLL